MQKEKAHFFFGSVRKRIQIKRDKENEEQKQMGQRSTKTAYEFMRERNSELLGLEIR